MTLAERLRGRRVGLALTSGFFGFHHHASVLEALHERGVRPVRVAGNSAGALVGALYAAGLDPPEVRQGLLEVRREDFWDPHWPLTPSGFGLLAGHRFAERLAAVLPAHGFESCAVPLAVGAYCLEDGRTRHFSSGPLVPAVRASCAVPYLFAPVEIDGKPYWDGGFAEKTPLVPFLEGPRVDVVVISHLPPREERPAPRRSGLLRFLPPLSAFLADTPPEERSERDRVSADLLRAAGIEVVELAPERVWLGPFSLDRAPAAAEQGRAGALAILDAS